MSAPKKVIPLRVRSAASSGAAPAFGGGLLADTRGRPMRDLRISVTDRCNFRCTYCMPREIFGRDFEFLRREELLTFEEIARLARAFVNLGVEKIRLTGGEPLLRRDLERLVLRTREAMQVIKHRRAELM